MRKAIWVILLQGIIFQSLSAQNPLIMDQFTADPTARVFNGKLYVYPSHDIPCEPGQGYIGFCMADYHVFSTEDLMNWTDHGVVLSQEQVLWAEPESYSMWAPDCIFKDGKYYFYFPAIKKGKLEERGRAIGVAISEKPYGPFIPEEKPIVNGIDANPFIDKDGKAYLYWADSGKLFVAGLSDDMLQLSTEPRIVDDLPDGFKEGPFLFERKGIYYFTFPHVANKTEELAYATSNSPVGPFTYRGIIMDESPIGCWTNHQSIVEYNDQWYLFYHHNDLSPEFDKNRSIKADSLFFNEDGTIQKVTPTLRGIGVSHYSSNIEMDRYSAIGEAGISIEFIDTLHTFRGWKTVLRNNGAWVQYNTVDFGKEEISTVQVNAFSPTGGTIHIRLNQLDGPLLTEVNIPKSETWNTIEAKVPKPVSGIHHLIVILKGNNPVEMDWVRFR